MSAQLRPLDPELREVVDPCGIGLVRWGFGGRDERWVGAVEGRDFAPDLLTTNLLGFLFSLANLACLATREILCCLGDPEADPAPAASPDTPRTRGLLPPAVLVRGGEALAAGVVVIRSPAAVLRAGGLGLLAAVMVVRALVMRGTVCFISRVEGLVRVVFTVLANVVGFD